MRLELLTLTPVRYRFSTPSDLAADLSPDLDPIAISGWEGQMPIVPTGDPVKAFEGTRASSMGISNALDVTT